MNCTCLKELEKKLLDNFYYDGKKVTDVQLPMSLVTKNGKIESIMTFSVSVELAGIKSKVNLPIQAVFCPTCGTKL